MNSGRHYLKWSFLGRRYSDAQRRRLGADNTRPKAVSDYNEMASTGSPNLGYVFTTTQFFGVSVSEMHRVKGTAQYKDKSKNSKSEYLVWFREARQSLDLALGTRLPSVNFLYINKP